jgi:hypothetical protein
MTPATKLALRRFTLRWLRKLVDVADDRLHAAEVTLRNDLSQMRAPEDVSQYDPTSVRSVHTTPAAPSAGESFTEWEARRSGIAPVSKKAARQRRERQGAAAFDLRYAR